MLLCDIYYETLEHLFANCMLVKTFWLQLLEIWNVFKGSAFLICNKDIFLGFDLLDSSQTCALNLLMLYGKRYIVKCRFEKSYMDIQVFLKYFQSHYAFRVNAHIVCNLKAYEIELTEFCFHYHVN